MVLTRIGVLSLAKICGVIYASIGLLIGLVFGAIFSVLPMADTGLHDVPSWLAPLFGVGAVVAAPIFYGAIGFIGGAFGAAMYNLFAGVVGGLELHLETTTRA